MVRRYLRKVEIKGSNPFRSTKKHLTKKVAVLFSGGKDSVYCTYLMIKKGFEPILISIIAKKYSLMFHYPNIKWTRLQAKTIGLKQYILKEDKNFENLKKLLKKLKVKGIAAGATYSNYQKERIEKLAQELKIKSYFPLWQKKKNFLKKMLREMEVYISAVAAEGLEKKYLAQIYTPSLVEELSKLKIPINIFFEGGEGETFVADAPIFKKRILIKKWKIEFKGQSGFAYILDAKLVKK